MFDAIAARAFTSLLVAGLFATAPVYRLDEEPILRHQPVPAVIDGLLETATGRIGRSVVLLEIQGWGAESDEIEYCSGTVVSPVHILTAAHCFDNVPPATRTRSVRIAGVGSGATAPGLVVLSPGYAGAKAPNQNHDVALIKYKSTLPRSLRPMRLARQGFTLAEGERVFLAGFGRSALNGSAVRRQLTSGSAIVYQAGSGLILKADPSYLAVGDSGGPSYVVEEDGEPVLVGINSGLYPATLFGGAVFSNVAEIRAELAWLLDCLDVSRPALCTN